METRFVEAHGIRFAYLEAGPSDGPLALCLHGFPDHAPTWESLLADLGAAGFRAVAPWLRGYAPSGAAPDGNYEAASLALDALALTDALAPGGDAVLVGHDWGAIAAYTAAGHRPDRFRRLVTMAVPHPAALMSRFLSSPDQLQRSWYIFFFQSPLADMVVPADDFAVIDKLWRDWSPGFTPDPAFMRTLKDTLAAPAPAGFAAAVAYYRFMLGTLPGDPSLAGVQGAGLAPVVAPTLYLHGADDGCMGVDMVVEAELAPLHPGGLEVGIVEGAGHFLHLERPEAVNPRVVDFLRG